MVKTMGVTVLLSEVSKCLCLFSGCVGGQFGTVKVRARTVGGGEQWDTSIEPTPAQTNDTIRQALGNRRQSRSAQASQDYVILDTVLTFSVSILNC